MSHLLDLEFAGRMQARLGEVHDVLALPGYVAVVDDEIIGVATYAVRATRAELAVLAVDAGHRRAGVGTALLEAVVSAVRENGVSEIWMVTTNDNLDALRVYQRRDFRLAELRPGAVEESRALKASIPLTGRYGIPLRDELILVRRVATGRAGGT